MSNVVAGDTVILEANLVTASTFTVTGTETFTCPSQLLVTKNVAGFVHNAFICYLVLASNHADFNVTLTVTSGSSARQGILRVFEFAGLGAVDTGSRVAANAFSTSFTTANASEMAFVFGTDLSDQVTPSGSNNFYDMLVSTDNAPVVDYRQLTMIQNTAGAGSYTASYTSSNSNAAAVDFVVVVAFQVSGGSPQGTIYADQSYHFLYADAGSNTKPAYLYNVTNGSKGVVTYHIQDNLASTCSVSSGESCFCPNNSFITRTVTNNYAQGICYVDFTGNHSGYVTFTISPGTSSASFDYIAAYLLIGLGSGIDSGSAASAAAQTVNYTTAFANEQTICLSVDVNGSYPVGLITPGNSFKPMGNGYSDTHNTVFTEGLDMQKLTVSSGSNTCSSTIGASTAAMISVLAFGPSAALSPRHSQIM